MRMLLVTILVILSCSGTHAEPVDVVRPFLEKHCFSCHGADKQENDLRVDTLAVDLSDVETLRRWQGILDQLNLGEMPPESEPTPDASRQAEVIDLLTQRLRKAYAARRSTGGKTVTRRLNRFELRNTVRDLLYINDPEMRVGNVARLIDNNGNGSVENTSNDPFRSFPGDEVEQGFDNIGNRLVMSDFLLNLMFDASEESLLLATEAGPRPKVPTRNLTGHIVKKPRGDLERIAREVQPDWDTFYRRETITPDELRGGVGTSCRYRITVEVSSQNQQHPWGQMVTASQDEPMRIQLRLFKTRTRNDHISLQTFEVPGDGQKRTFSVECWIDTRWTPQLIWENGPTDREARSDLIVKTFLSDKYRSPPDRKQITDNEKYKEARQQWSREMAVAALEDYHGPSVRIHRLSLEPLIDEWPPQSHTALYGSGHTASGQREEDSIEPLLLRFAKRAYRRPVTAEEISPIVELVRSRLKPLSRPESKAIQKLRYRAYQGKWSKLPDFSQLNPENEGSAASGLIDIRLAGRDDYFGLVFEGQLVVKQAGEYTFQLASDDGARMLVDGRQVIEHDGLHGASQKKGKLKLEPGISSLYVEYFAYGRPNRFHASWSGPGFQDVPLAVNENSSKKPVSLDRETARWIKALQAGYTAILCSPDFLYLRESGGPLTSFEIASRMSYFLWSSMPDKELFELAMTDRLIDPQVRRQQVDRMLADARSAAFTRHFTERWLRLDKLAETPPELTGPFRVYWDRRLEPQIVAQTDAYFADLVKINGPLRLLIDSDYTYLNEAIASVFYNRKDVRGESLRKVATNDRRRGGILTQPSVMTATANGVDTSPVKRGVWVLESILGIPPSPPPPDVEPLSPDLRNAKTISEQLKIHRQQEVCNRCHRKIDPLGFAFENFDPIGRWRERYPKGGPPIDASTTMANGREVMNVVELKQLLLEREGQVARCLTEKMLTYATGRLLEPTDRGEVDTIVEQWKLDGYRMRDLIQLVVQNDVFLTK